MKVNAFFMVLPYMVGGSWIDPDTPSSVNTTKPIPIEFTNSSDPFGYPSVSVTESSLQNSSQKEYVLVMSDEFNVPKRNFSDGSDPKWTAINKNDYTNDALHFYSHDQITTDEEGHLTITTEQGDTDIIGFDDVLLKKTHVTKHIKSGMLQSWNKFCFTGGIIETEVVLPGSSDVGGLWPAFWLLGNLARHTYVGSSAHIWPFSSDICSWQTEDAQKVNTCLKAFHYGLNEGEGRGASEIDVFEVQPGPVKANHKNFLKMPVGQPFMSSSYQVAPGKADLRPGECCFE